MKNFSFKPLRDWFGFSRRERRSSFILLIIITIFAGVRYIVPSSRMPVEMVELEIPERSGDTISQKLQSYGKQQYIRQEKRQAPVRIIELNTCDSASLEALPGIGPVLSARIIKYRNLLGGFAGADQLKEVYGLTGETFDLIRGRVSADPDLIRKININGADYRQLIRMPYFEKGEVTAILKYREVRGRIESLEVLVENGIIASTTAEKIKNYIVY